MARKKSTSIGSENYDSLSDAVKAAKDGNTIEVAEEAYTIDSPIAIDKKFTIKGTGIGKTVFNIVESEASDTKVIDINAEGVYEYRYWHQLHNKASRLPLS